MVNRYLMVAVATLSLGVAACEAPDEPPPPPTPEVEEHAGLAGAAPEESLTNFFQAIQEGEHELAHGLIAREHRIRLDDPPLDDARLKQGLAQLSEQLAHFESPAVTIMDVHQQGQFAIAAARYLISEQAPDQPVIRPIVLTRENGEWRIIWELMGIQSRQAMQAQPLAHQLEPLYEWYNRREAELELQIVLEAVGEPATG